MWWFPSWKEREKDWARKKHKKRFSRSSRCFEELFISRRNWQASQTHVHGETFGWAFLDCRNVSFRYFVALYPPLRCRWRFHQSSKFHRRWNVNFRDAYVCVGVEFVPTKRWRHRECRVVGGMPLTFLRLITSSTLWIFLCFCEDPRAKISLSFLMAFHWRKVDFDTDGRKENHFLLNNYWHFCLFFPSPTSPERLPITRTPKGHESIICFCLCQQRRKR